MRALLWLCSVLAIPAHAAELRTAPFLQSATPTSVWVVWETVDEDGTPTVRFGVDGAIDRTAAATSTPTANGGTLHEAHLTDLPAGARVTYEVVAGTLTDGPHALRLPAPGADPGPVRLLAMSDMQRDGRHPDVFAEVVADGALAWADATDGRDVADAFDLVLIPGDLVDDGLDYAQWAETFFAPLAPLSRHVPIYPVLGNHESDTPWYYAYFHLPDNGPEGLTERAWSLAQGNLLVVGLDSNDIVSWTVQLDWLDGLLDDACDDDDLDFVFAQLHHPFASEVWTPGNSPFAGFVVERLEAFSTRCGKPSVHFFGHTHAYSRGQSRDHRHLMVNVATAGGAIDRWGEHDQRDEAAFTVSTDDYGFVVVDVEAGDDPSLRVRRYSRGDADQPLDNELLDEITIRRFDAPPCDPVPRPHEGPVDGACVTLATAPFVDPDSTHHQATHWQLAHSCDDLDDPEIERWEQDENRYFGVDTQEGNALTDETFRGLEAGDWCWRARHRDGALGWSAWSTPTPFEATGPTRSADLVPDTHANSALAGWRVERGGAISTGDARCGTLLPVDGPHLLALGSACDPGLPAEVVHEVDLASTTWADGDVFHTAVSLVGSLTVTLTFLTEDGPLGPVAHDLASADGWERHALQTPIPDGVQGLRIALETDAPAQVDGVDVSVGAPGALTCATPEPSAGHDLVDGRCPGDAPVDTGTPDAGTPAGDDEPDDACGGCAGAPAPAAPFAVILGALFGRRRRAEPGRAATGQG